MMRFNERMRGAQNSFCKFVSLCAFAACFAGGALAQSPGSVDPAWNTPRQPPAPGSEPAWYDIATQPGGKLLVSGRGLDGSTPGSYVWRYAADGSLDQSFGTGGAARIAFMTGMTMAVDGIGRIYVHGRINLDPDNPFVITRLLRDGTVDPGFGNGQPVVVPGLVDMGPLPDGRIVLAYTTLGGTAQPQFVVARRLSADGSLDGSFGTAGVATLYSAPASATVGMPELQVTQDGGFMVAFQESSTQDNGAAHLRQYTANGARDNSFGDGGVILAPGTRAYDLELRPDGRIVLIARDAAGVYMIVQLTRDGRLDPAFGSGGVAASRTSQLNRIALDEAGGIIVATNTPPGSTSEPYLIRLTPTGAEDSSFVRTPIDLQAITDLDLGDGAYALTLRQYDEQQAERALRKFVLPPEPRGGSVSTGGGSSSAGFRVETQNLAGLEVESTRSAYAVGIDGFVYPQSGDLNASADIFVVVGTPLGYYMRNVNGAFVAWDGQISSLVPAYENAQLANRMHVQIYAGQLPFTGQYQLYLGYMRDGGPLIYSAAPQALTVSP